MGPSLPRGKCISDHSHGDYVLEAYRAPVSGGSGTGSLLWDEWKINRNLRQTGGVRDGEGQSNPYRCHGEMRA